MTLLHGLASIGAAIALGTPKRNAVRAEYKHYQESHDDGQTTNWRVIVHYDDGTTKIFPVIRKGAAVFLTRHFRERIRTGIKKPLPHGWWNK
jgi:uncharacterized beta-barrel protein YwiB (DUF1934 family)